MIQVRKSQDRGRSNHGWLRSRHTFSFGDYFDKQHMGVSVLRVINEDIIEGGTGFGTHGHRDMEIISYVIAGALEHKDSMGTNSTILPGEVQRMSAGTGVRHSEHNHLADEQTHFLQIWIVTEAQGLAPSYEQRSFDDLHGCSDMILVASRSGRNGSVSLHQDVDMYAVNAQDAGEKRLRTFPHRHLWLQVIDGTVSMDSTALAKGDGATVTGVEGVRLQWSKGAHFILFDLP